MRLSERMILGSTLIRHIHTMGDSRNDGCAIQCAYKAQPTTTKQDWINTGVTHCPVPDCHMYKHEWGVGGVIVHVNDEHKWSIDQIAQWIASIEPNEDSPEVDSKIQTPSLVAEEKHVYESR